MASESLVTVSERASSMECATSSSQNSLTGSLSSSSSKNSLPGSEVAGSSSQNPMPGGASCAAVDIPGSDLDCGQVAGSSGTGSIAGRNNYDDQFN